MSTGESERPVVVYVAGDIEPGDWRHQLFPDLAEACDPRHWTKGVGEWESAFVAHTAPPLRRGRFQYAGPFYVAGGGLDERWSANLRQMWLGKADVVFLFAASYSAAATAIAEAGYAAALNVPVWMFEPRTVESARSPLWMCRSIATVLGHREDPVSAFEGFEESCELTAEQLAFDVMPTVRVYRSIADPTRYQIGGREPAGSVRVHAIFCADVVQGACALRQYFRRKRLPGGWYLLDDDDVRLIRAIGSLGGNALEAGEE